MRYPLLLIGLLACLAGMAPQVLAQPDQDQVLAQQYLQNEEYEKAARLYEKLYKRNPSDYFYKNLYKSLLAIREYEALEKVVKKEIKKHPEWLERYVDLGQLYEAQGDYEKADRQYEKAISSLTADEPQIRRLAHAFSNSREYDYAMQTFEAGKKLLKRANLFHLELANLYYNLSEEEKAIENYLAFVDANPGQDEFIKNTLQRKLDDEDFYNELQQQLYGQIQRHPQQVVFIEMLIWLFIQKKDFKSALLQVKALDRRLNESGLRVLEMARSAANEKDYGTAIDAYQYVIDKGKKYPYYITARQELLKTLNEKITASDYSMADIRQLDQAYADFLKEFGVNPKTVTTVRDQALIKAFYLQQEDTAIAILENLLALPFTEKSFEAECKLHLGDFYLVKGEMWESTLLYSQVDKALKDEPLGELARFKNAKLSYYRGEFEWAQAQLDILKGSTSELISNDAIDLSVFITDNSGLDTTLIPMMKFARADLLMFRNQHEAALAVDGMAIHAINR